MAAAAAVVQSPTSNEITLRVSINNGAHRICYDISMTEFFKKFIYKDGNTSKQRDNSSFVDANDVQKRLNLRINRQAALEEMLNGDPQKSKNDAAASSSSDSNLDKVQAKGSASITRLKIEIISDTIWVIPFQRFQDAPIVCYGPEAFIEKYVYKANDGHYCIAKEVDEMLRSLESKNAQLIQQIKQTAKPQGAGSK